MNADRRARRRPGGRRERPRPGDSGCETVGTAAHVFFVNTDPGRRGRGIAGAMTAAALEVARGSGARQACLDASDAGLPIYLRLGFEPVAPTTRCSRT